MSMRNPSPMMRYWDWLDYQEIRSTMDVWPDRKTDSAQARRRIGYYGHVDGYEFVVKRAEGTLGRMIHDMPRWILPQDDDECGT